MLISYLDGRPQGKRQMLPELIVTQQVTLLSVSHFGTNSQSIARQLHAVKSVALATFQYQSRRRCMGLLRHTKVTVGNFMHPIEILSVF